jgi:hypothetical protein
MKILWIAVAVSALAAQDKPVTLETPASKGEEGKTHRHPLGLSYWLPAPWTAQDKQDFLMLTPPDPSSNADGPTEIYFILGESVAGEDIKSPSDPKVAAYLDGQVKSVAPFLARRAETTTVELTSGKGTVYEWEGKNPKGDDVVARAYVAIFKENAVALAVLALKDRAKARDEALRKIFASFAFGPASLDAKLARSWSFVENVTVSNQSPFESAWTRAQYGRETASTLTLAADGTWTRRDVSQAIMGAAGIWLDTGRQETVRKGRWCAGNGQFYLMYENDSWTVYQYRLEGDTLRLASGAKGEVWKAK